MYILYQVKLDCCDGDCNTKILGCYEDFESAKNVFKKTLVEEFKEGYYQHAYHKEGKPFIFEVDNDGGKIRFLLNNLRLGQQIYFNSNGLENISDFNYSENYRSNNDSCLSFKYTENDNNGYDYYLKIEHVEVSSESITEFSDYKVIEVPK
jgi:hypothetical protein